MDGPKMLEPILLYSAPRCSDCEKIKAYMDRRGIAYELRDIKANPEFAAELHANTGKEGVPYLVKDGRWMRAYEPGQPFSDEFARRLLGDR